MQRYGKNNIDDILTLKETFIGWKISRSQFIKKEKICKTWHLYASRSELKGINTNIELWKTSKALDFRLIYYTPRGIKAAKATFEGVKVIK